MSKTPWTPGPWVVTDEPGYGRVEGTQVAGSDGYIVALAIGDVEELPHEANARLIAAAPEMAEVLASIVKMHAIVDRGIAPIDLDKARALLARIRGDAA